MATKKTTKPASEGYGDPPPMTLAAKYAAIVALLKTPDGEWVHDVSGADFVQEVSIIIDTPTAPDTVDDLRAALAALVETYCYKADWTKPGELVSSVRRAGELLGLVTR